MKTRILCATLISMLSFGVISSAADFEAVSTYSAQVASSDLIAKIEKSNASLKNIESKFSQTKTLKVSGRKIESAGTLYYSSEGNLTMRYSQPVGELMVVNGNKFFMNKGGKSMTFDTSKNALMGSLAGTLLNSFKGQPSQVAKDNDAKLEVTETSDCYVVTLTAQGVAHRGYSKITINYRKSDCLILKMTMVETTGITTTYELKEIKKNTSIPQDVFKIPSR